MIFQSAKKDHPFYLYSRKHGDLERDYNFFSISPTFYSQGNGNYRDINQNRRLDVIFNPKLRDYNLRHFVNLLQLDGYNPLSIKEVRYKLKSRKISFCKYGLSEVQDNKIYELLSNSFAPGDVLKFVQDNSVHLIISFENF